MRNALNDAVARSHAPGAVACVGGRDGIRFLGAAGVRQLEPAAAPARTDTLYDLASLTKVVATTTAVMLLRDEGRLDLEQPVCELLPIPAFKFTVQHCLTHSAGLVAGLPYFRDATMLLEMLRRYSDLAPDWPAGTRRRYSDVSFMILGKIVEVASRDSLDRFCARRIFRPLGMSETVFNPGSKMKARCAATERCPWRGRMIVGEVHDENAWAAGGVSGHAGLFAPAGDLAGFCQALLKEEVLPRNTLLEMMRPGRVPPYPWQGLGWKIDPWISGSEGYLPSRRAIGHTGWTGTSMWIDFDTGVYSILLSNTCHPSRDARDSATLRRTFHTAVASQCFPDTANVHTGLDRLVWEEFDAVKGKKLALLTHHAAVDEIGRHILDVLALSDAEPRVIYTPEHGLFGDIEAGAAVEGQKAPARANVVSLYGVQKAPAAAELRAVDLFVVDLQDVGSRWYTYMATMFACMQACAKQGVPVLVLDRPNPVGGDVVEGPVAEDYGAMVCSAPIPVRHGMTMGELATFYAKHMMDGRKLKLSVSRMENWRASFRYDQCQLKWIAPSPNIPTPAIALLYTGMCLFEATNLNEGRGTDEPFARVGAPWMNPEAVTATLNPDACTGLRAGVVEYTPRSIPGRSANPRHRDLACRGIAVSVEDARTARPFSFAVDLISAIRKVHAKQFAFDKKGFDRLAGGAGLRTALERGVPTLEIVAGYAAELKRFDAIRPRLYG